MDNGLDNIEVELFLMIQFENEYFFDQQFVSNNNFFKFSAPRIQ